MYFKRKVYDRIYYLFCAAEHGKRRLVSTTHRRGTGKNRA